MFISREINEDLSERMWETYHGEHLPRMKFLIPNKTFWKHLKDIKESNNIMMFIDCGTGNGHIPKEAISKHKIKMAGCDVVKREDHELGQIQILPAHRMPMNKEVWPMACRPDHSGWVRGLLEKAMEEGSGFIYTGLRENMALDLGRYMLIPHIKYTDVGEDGEEMLVFPPQSL